MDLRNWTGEVYTVMYRPNCENVSKKDVIDFENRITQKMLGR